MIAFSFNDFFPHPNNRKTQISISPHFCCLDEREKNLKTTGSRRKILTRQNESGAALIIILLPLKKFQKRFSQFGIPEICI
jgi:hypothetical protein